MLDHHTALAAANPAHLVGEDDKEPSEGNKLKASFWQLVVTRCWPATNGAQPRRSCAWPQGHLDAPVARAKVGMMVDKTPGMVAAFQEGDQFHGQEDDDIFHNTQHHAARATRVSLLWSQYGRLAEFLDGV